MAGQEQSRFAEILLSCIEENYYEAEVALDFHAFARVVSGEMKVIQGDETFMFGPGDTLLFPCNQLSTLIKNPKDGLPYKAVVISFTPERLREFYRENPIHITGPHTHKIRSFSTDPLLESYFASLTPYFGLERDLPEKIVSMKIVEALTILRTIDINVDNFFSTFLQSYKLDIADFMEKNYTHNLTIERFSILTGRSLTTFKRDFKKAYHTTPQKWILQKRLELAHYKLSEKGRKPKDVYLATGFENLSHFSHAFKKHFGYAPTELPIAVPIV